MNKTDRVVGEQHLSPSNQGDKHKDQIIDLLGLNDDITTMSSSQNIKFHTKNPKMKILCQRNLN